MDNIFDQQQIAKKLEELDALKAKVEQLISLSELGQDVKKELDEFKELRSKGVTIPHLEKQFADQIYPKRPNLGRYSKPITQSEIQEAIDRAPSAKMAAKLLGVCYLTFKTHARKYGIHVTKGWPIVKGTKAPRSLSNPHVGKYPINDILDGKHPDFPIHRLKDKLIRSGIKSSECEMCGYKERRIVDGKIPLLLNFEDGDISNRTLENLKIYCFNCTFNCGRGYIKRGTIHFNMDPDVIQGAKKPIKARH